MGSPGITYTVRCMAPGCRKKTSNVTLWSSARKTSLQIPGWVVDESQVAGYAQWCSPECHADWHEARYD